MPVWDVVNGDCTTWLPEQAKFGLRVDCVICDPPYHLSSIQKRFGGMKADATGSVAERMRNRSDGAARLARGFMGSETDSGDVAFRPETWAAIASVMLPGARLAAFGGTRTFWKVAAAIDAAGFEIEDTIMWVYGQGLVLRKSRMKPAYEPIILARMPGRVLDLNIDDCRAPSEGGAYRDGEDSQDRRYTERGSTNFAAKPGPRGGDPSGRWPANLIHDGSVDVIQCFPDAPDQIAAARRDGTKKKAKVYGAMNHSTEPADPRPDSGSAARFFNCCEFSEDEKRLIYSGKASASERIFHCALCDTHFPAKQRGEHAHGLDSEDHITGHATVKPLALMRHLVRLIAPPGGVVLDPFAGSFSTIEAAYLEGRDSIGIEKDPKHAASAFERMRKHAG